MSQYVDEVLEGLKKKAPWESLFIQAATEILHSLAPVLDKDELVFEYDIPTSRNYK